MTTTLSDSAIEFHMMPADTLALKDSLGKVAVGPETLRRKMDEWFKEIVGLRLEAMDADAMVRKQLDRRIEVAIKGVWGRVEKEIVTAATNLMRQRLHAIVDEMPLSITVATGSDTPSEEEQ